MKINIVTATPEHAEYLAENLRDIDKKEAWALHRVSPGMAVNGSMMFSERAYTALFGDTPVLMFGVQSENILSDNGLVWLLASDEITKIKRKFVRQSRSVFLDLIKEYKEVYNYVHVSNKTALRWLRWLGFLIEDAKPLGANGEMFHKVIYRRD